RCNLACCSPAASTQASMSWCVKDLLGFWWVDMGRLLAWVCGGCFLECTPLWKSVTMRRCLTCMRPAVLHQKEPSPDFMQLRLLAILCTCWKLRGADFQQT